MKKTLNVDHLTKTYGERTVLDEISFSVEPGEALLFTGPNGSGKTTLFHLIAGLRRSDGGQIHWSGQPVEHLGKSRSSISLLPQDPGFQPKGTLEDTLRFYRDLRGLDIELEPVLSEVGLWDDRDCPVGEASGGMVQRLALALTLAPGPPLILLDEPANRLDPDWREWLADRMARQQKKGSACLISTHRLNLWKPVIHGQYHLEDGNLEWISDET